MTTGVSSASTSLPQAGTPTASAAPATGAAAPASAGTAATQQAAQGAQQAQPRAEAFNAPMLVLPDDPTTREVMTGLTAAMADPSINDTSAQALLDLHKQLMEAEKQMIEMMMTVNAVQ